MPRCRARTLKVQMRSLVVIAAAAAVAAQYSPSGHACMDPSVSALPFCDSSRAVSDRVTDLLSRMNLTEKMFLMASFPGTDMCATIDPGVERLFIPPVAQLIESNSGVSSSCWTDGQSWRCPTIFPSPLNLGASFNRSLWNAKGGVVSDEQRAFNNLQVARIHPGLAIPTNVSLYAFGPNINLVIDPRNGRVGEVVSEDPYLSGQYAMQYVQGLQEGEDPRYLKLIAFLKHFTAYEEETNRMAFDAPLSTFDLWDTYLPGYAAGFIDGRASGAMCSYASLNGVPMCANGYLLNDIIRSYWGGSHAVIMSDCGAIENQVEANHYAASYGEASAISVRAGTDVCDGTAFILQGGLAAAVAAGNLTGSDIDTAVGRALALRMRAGYFDPTVNQVYTAYGPEKIASLHAQAVNAEASAQGLVLLVNNPPPGTASRPTLPLDLSSLALTSVAVLGPHAVSTRELLGDYYEDAFCPGAGNSTDRIATCVPTLAASIAQTLASPRPDVAVLVAEGVGVVSRDSSGISAALAAANAASVIILALGNDNTHVEHEGLDRMNMSLPGLQEAFALQVLTSAGARGVPVILVLVHAGMVAIDNLLAAPFPPSAIVDAMYPSFGAPQLANAIFGLENRWGRLPYTVYPLGYENTIGVGNLNVSGVPGRTYRYYSGAAATWTFGHGMSYTDFGLACTGGPASAPASAALSVGVSCSSTAVGSAVGQQTGDQILLVMHRVGADVVSFVNGSHPIPGRTLVQFDRIGQLTVGGAAGSSAWTLPSSALGLTDGSGATVLYPGTHYLDVIPRDEEEAWTLTVTITGTQTVVLAQPPTSTA